MTLPVSSYEELLDRVRSLTRETRQLQRQIDSPLLDCNENERSVNNTAGQHFSNWLSASKLERDTALESSKNTISSDTFDKNQDGMVWTKEQGAPPETKEQEEISTNIEIEKSVKGVGVGPRASMCHSTIAMKQGSVSVCEEEMGGLSYSYSGASETLGTKVEMVYNLLSMLGTHDRAEMTSTLLAMSSSPDSCHEMRQSGCLSLLVQLVHTSGESAGVRGRAAQALRNMVLSHSDDKRGRREARVLRLLDQLIAYCDLVQDNPHIHTEEAHPGQVIAALMKLSFDEEHRLAMCQLGALYVIARLIQVEAPHRLDCCISVKRYAGMALTNLTFGDGNNKALLCSMKPFMNALVVQLNSTNEDLTQVTASVLRNLSWRADASSKQALRDVGAVTALMRAAMLATKEPTLKSVLSALWNLSSHCNGNKIDICAVDGAIQYLVEMLSYQSASKTLAVVENAGGVLRNISSHIADREDYRKVLREANCLLVLLRQLQSASLTVVSNACGTLWNLSARCAADQHSLVSHGAVPLLTSLAHSKHRMIAMGASAALKNLLPVHFQQQRHSSSSGGATLLARKKRALEAELNSTLGETCDNIEPGATWESDRDSNTSQSKDECEQINRSMKKMTVEETTEQPVDYSLKYRETETRNVNVDNENVNYKMKYLEKKEEKVYNGCYQTGQVNSEGDYAETDLDQLTNYSLRYNEMDHPDITNTSLSQDDNEAQVSRPSEPLTPAEIETSPEKHDSGKPGVLETPLMFSRCSSLGSLSSCEQVNDDCQSSVLSEFSRMTSGILSPSDLPDSPTQTVPPSPRTKQPSIPVAIVKETKPAGVFDDTVVAFKEESTPAQFSTATSLSDLTFDDEPNMDAERKELELPVVSEEEDEHVLADCIKNGMPTSKREVCEDRVDGRTGLPRPTGIPIKSAIPRHHPSHVEERPVEFCTEDTPASLSHATSQSELSLLSDEDHENVLAQCIQSAMPQGGMPKVAKKTSANKIPTAVPGVKVSASKFRSIPAPTTRMKQMVAEDEVSVFATEGSPCNFSVRSSLSDLTINTRPERSGVTSPPDNANGSPLSSLEPDVSVDEGEAVTVLSGTSADEVTLHDQEDQALLRQVISSGMPSASDTLKDSGDNTWAEDTVNELPSVSLTAPASHSYHTDRDDGVLELAGGGVALISHLDLEAVEPPSNMNSIISLGGGSVGPSSLGPASLLCSLDHVQPPSIMDSVLSVSSIGGHTQMLDMVRPPSDMDELLDLDNSITSVASLASEVADELPSNHWTHNKYQPLNDSRFNTYVVKSSDRERRSSGDGDVDKRSSGETDDGSGSSGGEMRPKDRIKQRRQADKDRFRTRTIHQPVNDIQRLSSVENEDLSPQLERSVESSVHSEQSESTSEPTDDQPRPIVVKPPEVKSVRGGVKSSIPVVRSPVKSAKKKSSGSNLPSPGSLQRQGTFTKEEPACSSIPIPVKKPTTIPSPLKKQPPPSGIGVGRGRASSLPSKAPGVRPSSSNQSLKSAASGVSSTTPPANRWHSNSSLNSPPSSQGKPPVSKIASLWKKVDESKKKQNITKDTRVWIPPDPSH